MSDLFDWEDVPMARGPKKSAQQVLEDLKAVRVQIAVKYRRAAKERNEEEMRRLEKYERHVDRAAEITEELL